MARKNETADAGEATIFSAPAAHLPSPTFPYLPSPYVSNHVGKPKLGCAVEGPSLATSKRPGECSRATHPLAVVNCVHAISPMPSRIRENRQIAADKHDGLGNQSSTFMEWKGSARRVAGDAETRRSPSDLARREWLGEPSQQAAL